MVVVVVLVVVVVVVVVVVFVVVVGGGGSDEEQLWLFICVDVFICSIKFYKKYSNRYRLLRI
jgi:hypothetical protein